MKRFGVVIALFAIVLVPWRASAQCTLPAAATFTSADPPQAIPNAPGCPVNGAIVTSTVEVSGLSTFLVDVDAQVDFTSPCTGELQMMLTSPTGRIVTLFSNQSIAACEADEFENTIWDDDADPSGQLLYTFNNNLVTDRDYAGTTAPATRLVPEEAMGAFIGEDPNGTWTLSIVDQCNGFGPGALNGWNLRIKAVGPPTTTAAIVDAVVPAAPDNIIPDNGSTSFNVTVAGVGTFLTDIDVITSLASSSSGDIQMTIKSPQNTFVTLTTRSGIGANNFNGTIWDDQSNFGGDVGHPIVGGNSGVTTDHDYSPNNVASVLVPEEALSAFFGEDPNGIWQLTIADRVPNASVNTLSAWSLNLETAECAPPTPTPTNTPGPSPTPTITPPPTPTVPFKVCNGLPATVVGTTGDDLLIGSDGDDVIHGKGGNDEIKGRSGADILCGGSGNDIVRGGGDADVLKGGSGNDFIKGGGDRDVLLGNKGDDTLNGGDADDTCVDDNGSNSFVKCETIRD